MGLTFSISQTRKYEYQNATNSNSNYFLDDLI